MVEVDLSGSSSEVTVPPTATYKNNTVVEKWKKNQITSFVQSLVNRDSTFSLEKLKLKGCDATTAFGCATSENYTLHTIARTPSGTLVVDKEVIQHFVILFACKCRLEKRK